MMTLDMAMLLAGLALGAGAAVAFFVGLALGMTLALRRANPAPVLMLSAAVRIALLLALGWAVGTQGGAEALAGFALAFMVARFVILRRARPADPTPPEHTGDTPWN